MSRWFRFYDRALDDPKVQRLPADVFKGWINLLCLAARDNGKLPGIPDIAFALRISDREAESLITTLMDAGLLDDGLDGMEPHRWNDLQFVADGDRTAAERAKRYREKRNGNVTRDVTRDEGVTSRPPEQNRTENRTEQTLARDASLSAFSSGSGFPRKGSIAYSAFAPLIRANAPGRDVDMIATEFRAFCLRKDIDLGGPHIGKTLATFCKKQRAAA